MAEQNIFIGPYDDSPVASGVLRLAVKDNIDVAGMPTTLGTRARANTPPAQADAAVVARLRTAPVTIVGKTNLDELANGATGINPWYGAVANPTDPTRIAGGSSSGSAAAVGFGLADIALGTDTGGSLRIPAALCGVAGFKPSKGLFSTLGVYPTADRMDVIGPMARDIAGLRRAFSLMAPEAARDDGARTARTIARLRFGQEETIVDETVDAALAGVDVVDLEIPGWQEAHFVAYTIIAHQCWTNNRELLESAPEDVGAVASAVILDGEKVTTREYGEAFAFANRWSVQIQQLFADYDLLACPTVSTLAPQIEGLGEIQWESFSRTMQFNLSGHPALSAPLDVPGTHLKTGIQLIGPYAHDGWLLARAQELLDRV